MLTPVRERGRFAGKTQYKCKCPVGVQSLLRKTLLALNREATAHPQGTAPPAEPWTESPSCPVPAAHNGPTGHPGRMTLSTRSTTSFRWELAGLLGKTCRNTCAFPGSHFPWGLCMIHARHVKLDHAKGLVSKGAGGN